ncbi:MAG: tetratricopeptide repeat protein, partial [Prochlorothrix sp.]
MDYLELAGAGEPGRREAALEEMLGELVRALRRKRGFGLFFVQCQRAQGEEIMAAVRERLPGKRVRVFELERGSESLYGEMLAAYGAEGFEVAFVVGMEQAVLGYEDTRRLAGWGSGEIYSTSWKGVPTILGHLNRQREAFAENIPVCLVFLVPSFVIDYFVQRAADFFDWRSGFFKVPEDGERLQQSAREMVGKDFEEYENLSQEERLEKIFEIKQTIQAGKLEQAELAELLREQGRLFHAGKEYYAALDCYDRAINLKSDYHEAWFNRGNALANLKRYEEAIAS